MKTLYLAIIVMMEIMIVVSSFNSTFAQNVANSSNVIPQIPSSILHSPVPTLSPSESQSVINVALTIPELQNWSHDWHYVNMGFLGNNKAASGDFEWQYAIISLKAPSSSAPVSCDNNWWAWVDVDMITMKVVQASYPTMESHSCQVITGGGPTLGGSVSGGIKLSSNTTNIESPLKQFKSGTPASDVKCNDGLQLILKREDNSPSCVKPNTAQVLIERGWALNYVHIGDKESISLSAYHGISTEAFYNNGTVVSNFTIDVNIKNFTPSNTLLVLQVYYNDGSIYKTISMPSDAIQPDGFYKYDLIAVSDKNHPVPFKIIATYNNETAITYAPVFTHP